MVKSRLVCLSAVVVLVAISAYYLLHPLPACYNNKPNEVRTVMRIFPVIRAFASLLETLGIVREVELMRAATNNIVRIEDTETLRTTDTVFDGVPVRIYLPAKRQSNGAALMYIHGGGWVIGNIAMVDKVVRELSEQLNVLAVSVDYRLAPDVAYPAAIDDVERAFRYLAEHASEYDIDATRIAVAGDSAGGNLAAALTIRLREAGRQSLERNDEKGKKMVQAKLQVLIYPVTQAINFSTVSMLRNQDDLLLPRWMMRNFVLQYVLGMDYYNTTLRNLAIQYIEQACYKAKRDLDKLFKQNSRGDDVRERILTEQDRRWIAQSQVRATEFEQECSIANEAELDALHKRLEAIFEADVSPVLVSDTKDLPAAYVVSCGMDVRRDDALLYIERLRDAGVQVEHKHKANECHGYFGFEPNDTIDEIKEFLEDSSLL